MAITLTAGDLAGTVQGYARVGSSLGANFGSISAELVGGQTLDYLITGTGGGSDAIAFVGNQSPTLLTAITVNGVSWTVGTGVYNGSTVTEYPLTTSGGEFVNAVAYTIDTGAAAPNITTAAAQFNVEAHPLNLTLTADKPITTWAIIGGADSADFEISGSTLRWASNGTKDHSAPDDADTNNTYIVQVEATDAGALTDTLTITVTIEAIKVFNKVDKFGNFESNVRGGADVFDQGMAGVILTADYFESAPTAPQIILSNATHALTSTGPTISVKFTVSVNDGNHGQVVTSPTLAVKYAITVNSALHGHSATSPSLAVKYSIAPANAFHANTVTSPSITLPATAVTVNDAVHGLSSTSPTIAAKSNITVNDAAHGHSATSPSIAVKFAVSINDATSAHSATSPSLGVKYAISVSSADHANQATSPTLAVKFAIASANADHAVSSTSPSIAVKFAVAPTDALHAQTATSPSIAPSALSIAINGAAHAVSSESPSIAVKYAIAANNSGHSVVSTSPSLQTANTVSPSAALHAHQSGQPAISVKFLIAANDAAHGHEATAPSITVSYSIIVSDASHQISSPQVFVVLPTVTPDIRKATASGKSRHLIADDGRSLSATINGRSIVVSAPQRTKTAASPKRAA